MWTKQQIEKLVAAQRTFFRGGRTYSIEWRILQLKRLRKAIAEHEEVMEDALYKDLGRSKAEAYFCDIGSVIAEINETIHGLKKWAKPETHYSGLVNFPSMVTRVYKLPYGTTLIISPFNFPFMLSLGVLTAAIAGGNTAVIKTSSKSFYSTEVLKKIIGETFPKKYIAVVDGGHDVADDCLNTRFDKIFYTGSPRVGVHVMEQAAKNLTPVALELGGENGNWCIVRKDANLRDAARKIAFFKLLNSGQVCININQVAVAKEVADRFIQLLKEEFVRQIGKDAVHNPEYPKLISNSAYCNCAKEVEKYRDRVVFGGQGDEETCKYAPTIIYPVKPTEDIVMHELFAPILPVVTFEDAKVKQLLSLIGKRESGLSLYLFTRDVKWAKHVMSRQQYGGGCINEVCVHLMVKGVPFGGLGHSGMGAYHGEWGFREFTHPSTVLIGNSVGNLPLREHPYTGKWNEYKLKLVKIFER
ncbi:MAG: aldehyde dehydrogenase family protein [Lachnospiraceae bacterium]|nr:aldehyde dehydrogenase family protein [Lachnospiraceae bacterium]